jgi:hypothetical protein
MKRPLLAALLAIAFAAPALANDSTAELAAGGLVLTRTDAIEMRKTNWRPENDLWILILKPLPPEAFQ